MASEIRVDKITSLSGVGTISPSPTGVEIAGITTVATLKATTGIVTTLTATTGIVTTFEATTGNITTLRAPTGIVTTLTTNTLTANSTTKVGSGVTLSPDGDVFATGITTVGGNLMVGDNQTPEVPLHVHGNALIENTIGNHLTVRSTVNNGNDANIRLQKGRGGGTPAIVQNGDDIGDLSWAGYDGDSYLIGADILGEVDGTPADDDMPMRLTFKTRSAGAGQAQGRLRIHADGLVSLENNSNLQIPDKIIHSADTDTAIRFPAADTISFETGGTERARFTSNGLCIGGTGSANALDDYEFGDWTPKQTDGGTNYTANHAKYVKIGRFVHLSFDIVSSSATNLTQIWNLPFTPSNYSTWHTAYYAINGSTTGTGTSGYGANRHGGLVVPSSGGYLHTRIIGGTVTWNITNTDRLIGSASYETTE